MGGQCANEECRIHMHDRCVKRFQTSSKSAQPVCMKCKTQWPTSSSSSSSRGSRNNNNNSSSSSSSGGGRGSRRRQSGVTEILSD